MKTSTLFSKYLPALLLGLAGQLSAVHGADSKTTAASTNATPLEITIAKSVFTDDASGKDPFFPLSTRPHGHQVTTAAAPASISAACFQLKGLSGSMGSRLVLINNRTFAEGESDEVTTASCGKARIRVIKIKEFSVVIQAEGQGEFEISLPKDAR